MRLLDSSIWIAFGRVGALDLLLSLPDLAASRLVHGEPRLGRDDLAERTKHLVDDSIDTEIDEGIGATLVWVLKHKQPRLSQVDAAQLVYAQAHSGEAALYMRDGDAESVAAGIGVEVRGHTALVTEMQQMGLIDAIRADDVLKRLKAHFERRGDR